MLNSNEHARIYEHACVPEHIPAYVTAIFGGKPYLFQDHLCYFRRKHLILIGYPLAAQPAAISQVYSAACKRFKAESVMVVGADLSGLPEGRETQPADQYYRLNLPLKPLPPDVAYMVRRAARELVVEVSRFGREHKKIIKDFIGRQVLSDAQVHIFKQVPDYMKRSKTACLLEARKSRRLVAFSIVDLGSARYAFYQFNFRSARITVPGASDLLFSEMVRVAQSEGKQAINLGLGVHPGIRRFKEKWGGAAFLTHHSALIHRKPVVFGKLADKL